MQPATPDDLTPDAFTRLLAALGDKLAQADECARAWQDLFARFGGLLLTDDGLDRLSGPYLAALLHPAEAVALGLRKFLDGALRSWLPQAVFPGAEHVHTYAIAGLLESEVGDIIIQLSDTDAVVHWLRAHLNLPVAGMMVSGQVVVPEQDLPDLAAMVNGVRVCRSGGRSLDPPPIGNMAGVGQALLPMASLLQVTVAFASADDAAASQRLGTVASAPALAVGYELNGQATSTRFTPVAIGAPFGMRQRFAFHSQLDRLVRQFNACLGQHSDPDALDVQLVVIEAPDGAPGGPVVFAQVRVRLPHGGFAIDDCWLSPADYLPLLVPPFLRRIMSAGVRHAWLHDIPLLTDGNAVQHTPPLFAVDLPWRACLERSAAAEEPAQGDGR